MGDRIVFVPFPRWYEDDKDEDDNDVDDNDDDAPNHANLPTSNITNPHGNDVMHAPISLTRLRNSLSESKHSPQVTVSRTGGVNGQKSKAH